MQDFETNEIVIGLVIADEMEFIPFKEAAQERAVIESDYLSEALMDYFDEDKICECVFEGESNPDNEQESYGYRIIAVQCGIGKVNAAFAATILGSICNVDMMLNVGLSGAVKGVRRGDIVIGTSYTEADIDVSPLGYEKGIKPGEKTNIFGTYEPSLLMFRDCTEGAVCASLGCGDFFLAGEIKKFYIDNFDIAAFDMETGAIACVCNKLNIPFQSIRKVSDDSDDCKDQYNEMNNRKEQHLSNIIFDSLYKKGYMLFDSVGF